MKKLLMILAGLAGIILAVIAAAYVVLLRADPPAVPHLSGTLLQDTLWFDGHARTYNAYVPENLADRPALLLALHGSRGDGEVMRRFTAYAFDRLADRESFIVVYPDGFERHWNDCRKSGPYLANTLGIDDVGFMQALIRHFQGANRVDPAHVFAVGFSNGGHLAYRLALEVPDAVRGVAAVGANLPVQENMDCTPSGRPASVLIMNGTDDPINPYGGGEVSIYGFGKRGAVRSSAASAQYFSWLAGYAEAPARSRTPGAKPTEATWVEQVRWAAPTQHEVCLVTVHGGGHTIPQPYYRFPRLLGKTSTAIDGPAEIWSFFRRQMPAGQATVASGVTSRPAAAR